MNNQIYENNKISYSVIIPCYNAEGSIKKLVNEIVKHSTELELFTLNEIICVNDNSKDNSLEVLLKMETEIKVLKLINNSENLGQVKSTLKGIEYSNSDFIITLDDDLQHPPKEINKLLLFCYENKFDFVTGFWKNDETFFRNITSFIANFLINLSSFGSLNYRITAFRVINKKLKIKILKKFKNNDLMDLRKISNNYGSILIEHNPNPLNRNYSNFLVRFRITIKYIFIDNFLLPTILSVLFIALYFLYL